MRKPSVEQALREALSNPKTKDSIAAEMEWDASNVSRFLSGQMGVPIHKLETIIKAIGYVMVTPRYLDNLAGMAETGVFCRCAREGLGNCGR